MVKRTPPLTLGLIGTGETSVKNAEALLNDYTSTYAEVALVVPIDDAHWSPTLEAALAWAGANDIPYVAVTDGSSPSKSLVPLLEAADSVIKVARVASKIVQLLAEQSSEGEDVALMVCWDDDDNEAATAVTRALGADVKAFNLCDGLDPFEFDEDGDEGQDDSVDHAALDARQTSGGRAGASAPEPSDDYATKGVRALRALLRTREGHGLTDRSIGQLEKDEAIAALRKLDGGDVQPAAQEDDDEAAATPTTKARRAFAEGAAEGRGDEAQAELSLPNSRGADILENETSKITANPVEAEVTLATGAGTFEDSALRHRALELAISGGSKGAYAIADAMKYEVYLKGQRQSAGRPRADGTPAQAREIDPETGRPKRRKPSSTD